MWPPPGLTEANALVKDADLALSLRLDTILNESLLRLFFLFLLINLVHGYFVEPEYAASPSLLWLPRRALAVLQRSLRNF